MRLLLAEAPLKNSGRLPSGYQEKVIQNINSTFTGGGVAEILARMVPLLNQIGVDAQWSIIKGQKDFFDVTKKFHNALHGRKEDISSEDFSLFMDVSKRNIEDLKLHGDIMFIHDPQPIALIAKKKSLEKSGSGDAILMSLIRTREFGIFYGIL